MRVLVTGGSGYFGTRLLDLLSLENFDIHSMDKGYFWNCWFGDKTNNNEFKFPAEEIVEKDLVGFEAVIHFAGISNDPLKQINESTLHDPSLRYTRKIAEICKKRNIRFIYASSCSVYGKQTLLVDELCVANPQTPYSLNKLQIEGILSDLASEDWRPMILRFATLYGYSARMRFDTVINMFCGMSVAEKVIKLNSDGRAKRPFVYIDDAISVLKWSLRLTNKHYKEILEKNLIINVGSNKSNFSISEIAQLISEIKGNTPVQFQDIKKLHELVQDRKLQDGADSRSYEVKFDRLNTEYPDSLNFLDMKDGVKLTLDRLIHFGLDSDNLYKTDFYRLQYLEESIENKILDSNLEFI
jgi:nucleoside-diphosphate-sugar epimerase